MLEGDLVLFSFEYCELVHTSRRQALEILCLQTSLIYNASAIYKYIPVHEV